MRLKLPPSLHYPITVSDLLKQPDEDVERSQPIFSYSYKTTFESIDRDGNAAPYEESVLSRFESSVDGKLQKWFLKKGDVILGPGYVAFTPNWMDINGVSGDIVEIDEPCVHSVQFAGMCANCGKDMTE